MRVATAIGAGGVSSLLIACANLLGIEAIPVRGDAGEAIEASVLEAAPSERDAADASSCDPNTYCGQKCERALFCEDFEQPGDPAARWNTALGPKNPLLINQATLRVELGDAGGAPNHVLFAEAASPDRRLGAALLIRTMEENPAAAAGLRISVTARILRIDRVSPNDAGLRAISLVGVGDALDDRGIALGVEIDRDDQTARVVAFDSSFLQPGRESSELQEPLRTGLANYLQNWMPMEIAIAVPEALAAAGRPCVADLDAGAAGDLHVALVVFGRSSPCFRMPGPLADAKWLTRATVFVGAGVEDYGSSAALLDDVAIEPLVAQ